MSNSIPVLPLLFDQLSRKRHRLDGSLHWHWQELLIAHHWKQQQTQILFEYRGFYLAALLTQLVDFHICISVNCISLSASAGFVSHLRNISLIFWNAFPVCLQKIFYLPRQLTFPPPVGFCLPAALGDDMTWTRHLLPTSPTLSSISPCLIFWHRQFR